MWLEADVIFVDTASSYASSDAVIGNALRGGINVLYWRPKAPRLPVVGRG